LQHVDPLLGNDREISKYTKAVIEEWLGKHIPITTIELQK
jgi:hypothetical protein